MTEPLVSVGIPTYNNPEGLEKTLANFMCQTYQNLEIIVSVNPSNGDTNNKYRGLIGRYNNVKWHFQSTNTGLIDNFWFVLEQATGEYFVFAQDDDEWSLGFINGLVSLLEINPSVSVAMSKVQRRTDTGEIFDTFDMKNISVLNAMHDEKLAFVFMGVWRINKLRKYSEGRTTDIAIDAQAILDGGVMINPHELYTKGMRHDKAKEQIQANPFWYFHIYWSLLKGVYRINRMKVPMVAVYNFVWVIRSYAAQILFLLPVDHPIRKTVRKLTSHS